MLSVSVDAAWADPSPDAETRPDASQSDISPVNVSRAGLLKREAPVFTYRQVTAQLPELSAWPDDPDPSAVTAFNLPAQPTFPEPAFTAGRERAGLMGRFGRTIDAGPAQHGLSAPPPDRSEPSASEPATTAAVAERPAAPGEADRAEAGKPHLLGSGRASWYKHPGKTASGETYDPNGLTAAHHSLPFGTKVKVVNTRNGRSVVVRITDRTNERTKAKRPYTIDLSRASAQRIGLAGIGRVALYRVD